MDRRWWNKPVAVRKSGITYQVNNVLHAANMLLDEWPDTSAAAWKARSACMAALEGGDKDAAREAFEAAARAAGVLVETA